MRDTATGTPPVTEQERNERESFDFMKPLKIQWAFNVVRTDILEILSINSHCSSFLLYPILFPTGNPKWWFSFLLVWNKAVVVIIKSNKQQTCKYKLAFPASSSLINIFHCTCLHLHTSAAGCSNQQRLPFLQLSAPAPFVIVVIREEGLAPKLEALA